MAYSAARGFLSIILTGHVPYVRSASRHPTGEEVLHETIAYSLLPTLNILADLRSAGFTIPITFAYSPILLEQLADIVVQKHFTIWMEEWIEALVDDLARWERQKSAHISYLARFSIDWGRETLHSFVERHGRNLVTTLRELCASGAEPLFTAATHAFLPLLATPESVNVQLHHGRLNTMWHLGVNPHGLWLPECAYSPSLADSISNIDARYVVVDPASIAGSNLSPNDVLASSAGPWGVFTRDTQIARHLALAAGYPGDPLYRAPARDPRIDLAMWRNGTAGAPPELYDPYDAYRRAEEHAIHFVEAVAAQLERFSMQHNRPGVVVVALDAELLGRRWFEGPVWLRTVLMRAAIHPTMRLATPSAVDRLATARPTVTLSEASWADGPAHRLWNSGATRPLWEALAEAEERFRSVVAGHLEAEGAGERMLNQALRELMLAQSSDWPLLVGQNQFAAPAIQHMTRHLERLEQLCRMVERAEYGDDDMRLLVNLEELDNPFPHLNFRIFHAPETPQRS